MAKKRLAIVSTHPIQYYSPVFRALASSPGLHVRVFFTWSQAADEAVFDEGFRTTIKWDIPLLEGFEHQFVANVARRPGLHHFRGLVNPTLAGEIEAWQADAVLIYTWNSYAHLQALRYFKGRVPVLFRGDSTLLDPRPWVKTQLRRAFLTWVYGHVDVAIAVGTKNYEYFRWCGLPTSRISIAPHSVDTARFAVADPAHERQIQAWRELLNIDPEAIVFLFAGKLQSKKDPVLLLEAFAGLEQGHLVFVGNGDLEQSLRHKAATIRNVNFLPFQNQRLMPAVYRLGDVFVLPSRGPEETWGLAINEAMASGRPVVASSMAGGACDLVVKGENGWIFQSGDVDELRRVLRAAIECGKADLRAMGAAALKMIARFSTEESASRIADAVTHHGR